MSLTTQRWGLALAVAAVSSGTPTQAALGPELSFKFSQSGYAEGATVTGSFSGMDEDGNGILAHFPFRQSPPVDFLELTSFSMRFSGNSLAPAFDLALDDLLGFAFEIDSGGIGDDPATDPTAGDITEGIAAVGADFFYTSGLGPNSMIGGHVGGEIELNDLLEIAEHALDSSDLLVQATLVPEPSTLAMLLAGILATFAHRSRARR
jgi:hypothetical protein